MTNFVFQYCGRTKYAISDEEYDDIPLVSSKNRERERLLLLRDFCGIIRGHKIPSWFPNKKYYPLDENNNRREYEIELKIAPYLHDSEWCGIVVCLLLSFDSLIINWSSKAAEDDDYIFKDWAHYIDHEYNQRSPRHLCIMVLELNEETCWQHLRRSHNNDNSLHIKLSTFCKRFWEGDKIEIMGFGWEVIYKEKIRECRNDEVKLPCGALDRFIRKVHADGKMDKNACSIM